MNYSCRGGRCLGGRCFGGRNWKWHGVEFMNSGLNLLWRHRFRRVWGLYSRSRDSQTNNGAQRRPFTFRHSTEHLPHPWLDSLPASLRNDFIPKPFLLHPISSPITTCLPNSYWWKCQVCSPETLLWRKPTCVGWILARIRWRLE